MLCLGLFFPFGYSLSQLTKVLSIIVTNITVSEFSNIGVKVKCFDGTCDVNDFLEKVSLHSSLKGYDGEIAAQNLASKLEGRALDVYMRLSTDDTKKLDKIQSELLK